MSAMDKLPPHECERLIWIDPYSIFNLNKLDIILQYMIVLAAIPSLIYRRG